MPIDFRQLATLLPEPWQSGHMQDGEELVFASIGSGGPGFGTIPAQIFSREQPSFLAGITATGSGPTSVKVSGNQTAYVGYYFVGVDVGGLSVPILAASYNAATDITTLTISFVTGIAANQNFEISLWPGGANGRARAGETAVKYEPPGPRALFQIGPNTGLYQADDYGTVYLIGFNGTGANGDHFRDFRCADIGVDAMENFGTYNSTAPGGTEPARTINTLNYHGGETAWYRTNNGNGTTTRDKAASINGTTGDHLAMAKAATALIPLILSPKYRMDATYWDGAQSQDRVGYIQTVTTDSTGGVQIQFGFEHRGSGSLAILDGATAGIMPVTDLGAGFGTIANRFLQAIAGPNGFRVWGAQNDANPVAELTSSGLRFGPGAAAAVDTLIRRGGVGFVSVPMLVKAGVPTDGDYAVAPPNGSVAINSLTDVIYYRKAGVWTATTA